MNCKNPDVLHKCTCGKHSTATVIEQMEDQTKPFTEEMVGTVKIRTFDKEAPTYLYKWHADDEDRFIQAVHENDWQFQFDNELPQSLEPNKIINIPKGLIHRLIKGSSELSIKITT